MEEGLPLFLNSILDRAVSSISAGSTNMDEIQTCLVFVDRTISLLRLIIQEVDEIDKQEWHTIESCFELILQSLHDYASELARRPTTLISSKQLSIVCHSCLSISSTSWIINRKRLMVRSTNTRHVCISSMFVLPALIELSARSRIEFKNRGNPSSTSKLLTSTSFLFSWTSISFASISVKAAIFLVCSSLKVEMSVKY